MRKRIVILFVIMLSVSIVSVYAQNIGIEVGNNYLPGDDVEFKITIYDEGNNRIDGEASFIIQNYYAEVIEKGVANSGEEKVFVLPENAIKGHWAVVARYDGKEQKQLFSVGELGRMEVKLEADNLVVTNVGNIPVYGEQILISIGGNEEIASVSLEVVQVKKIRLTGENKEYDVRIVYKDNVIEKQGISLTGNVVGLESVLGDSFWKKYPMVFVFLIAVGLVVVVVFGLKFTNRKK